MKKKINFLLWLFGFCLLWPAAAWAKEEEKPRAEIGVSGLGWLRNREMRVGLERLLGSERREHLSANAIEDAAFLLISALTERGYLRPKVKIAMERPDGSRETIDFDATLETPLPRTLIARAVTFHVERGVRYHIENVEFSGLTVIPEETAETFFRSTSALFATKGARVYSPDKLRGAAGNLEDQLRTDGYAEAVVEASAAESNHETGATDVQVKVREGQRTLIEEVRVEPKDGAGEGLPNLAKWKGKPWTVAARQDIGREVRHSAYQQGYADARVQVQAEPPRARAGDQWVPVVVTVALQPKVTVGQIRFEGNERTRESVLRRRVRLKEGDPLNPLELDRSRYRLARLGVFDSVDLQYEPPAGSVRDAVFVLDESGRYEVSLLAGYGSYEQLRGGVEVRQRNILGRGHDARLELIQSMKSSRGQYTYSVPELFGETVDGTARLFGLQRQERAFLRQEYGGSFLVTKSVSRLRADVRAGYTFQDLRSKESELTTRGEDAESLTVASVDLGITRDRRDNALRPRAGYRWFGELELASPRLGGEGDYQRFELGAAWHSAVARGRWFHAGVTHGVITTLGADDRNLPVNKRFFPGGDASIRGYGEGEAAPRGGDGRYLGAKTYVLVNVEFEQAIVGDWSGVLFLDALGQSATLSRYPVDEHLSSVGLGIRYQTVIGPIRLEYGYNLHRREQDPSGALHFAVGYPF